MSLKNQESISRRTITVIGCGFLVVISLVTFWLQIPTIAHTTKIYDKKYIDVLGHIGEFIPQNETLATTENYPQVEYFSGHEAKVPWLSSERALVQFMWKVNSSYLLVPEDTSEPPPDSAPLIIQAAEKQFEIISDYYDEFISNINSYNTSPQLNHSKIEQSNTPLKMDEAIRGKLFQKLFDKVSDYSTEGSIIHLYHLRSNITRDNLSIITDETKPLLFVSRPINGTVLESKFGVLHINVTGTAKDVDSNIKKVELSLNGLPYKLANPRAADDDWSTWSFLDDIVTHDVLKIMVRATDNADNRMWVPVNITIK
jgi:hypothetical protein